MSKTNNKLSASLAGEISLGSELRVHRLGFGAMRAHRRRYLGATEGSQVRNCGSSSRDRTGCEFHRYGGFEWSRCE